MKRWIRLKRAGLQGLQWHPSAPCVLVVAGRISSKSGNAQSATSAGNYCNSLPNVAGATPLVTEPQSDGIAVLSCATKTRLLATQHSRNRRVGDALSTSRRVNMPKEPLPAPSRSMRAMPHNPICGQIPKRWQSSHRFAPACSLANQSRRGVHDWAHPATAWSASFKPFSCQFVSTTSRNSRRLCVRTGHIAEGTAWRATQKIVEAPAHS
ncbi:hypothetical protein FHS83_002252 [Rhizomicrobium palustre]|uniref:Uncharacterized protein n=1 Tax=Rhizomicrobium palustre TaxID=189966 RepID=A0A846MZ55_9PROT|nr:hypothetical protein [Rhizomicrobium palustre]